MTDSQFLCTCPPPPPYYSNDTSSTHSPVSLSFPPPMSSELSLVPTNFDRTLYSLSKPLMDVNDSIAPVMMSYMFVCRRWLKLIHRGISKKQAEELLRSRGRHGSFLLRASRKQDKPSGFYTLCLRVDPVYVRTNIYNLQNSFGFVFYNSTVHYSNTL